MFDLPNETGTFEDRIKKMNQLKENNSNELIHILDQTICKGKDHLEESYNKVVNNGGEGIILRKPGSLYTPGRSHLLYRYKVIFHYLTFFNDFSQKFLDTEVKVIEILEHGMKTLQ